MKLLSMTFTVILSCSAVITLASESKAAVSIAPTTAIQPYISSVDRTEGTGANGPYVSYAREIGSLTQIVTYFKDHHHYDLTEWDWETHTYELDFLKKPNPYKMATLCALLESEWLKQQAATHAAAASTPAASFSSGSLSESISQVAALVISATSSSSSSASASSSSSSSSSSAS